MTDKPKESELQCPYCKSTDIIKRGTAKREGNDSVQVYGCKGCKRRFTSSDTTKPIPNTMLLKRCQFRIEELEGANQTLLDNNVKLAAENTRLVTIADNQHSKMLTLEKEKTDCKQKCEVVSSEKDRKIRAREEFKAECKTTYDRLRNGSWTVQVQLNQDGTIALTHTVKIA